MSIDRSETSSHIDRKQVSLRDSPCKCAVSAVGGQKHSRSTPSGHECERCAGFTVRAIGHKSLTWIMTGFGSVPLQF